MTNKDLALIIVNKLFEMCEKDQNVTFSGHMGGMVLSYKCEEGFHTHIDDFNTFKEQMKQINRALDEIKKRQDEQ